MGCCAHAVFFTGEDMLLNDDISRIKGIGSIRAKKLNDAGIFCIEDVLKNFPIEYRDIRSTIEIKDVAGGEYGFFKLKTVNKKWNYLRGAKSLFYVKLSDGKNELYANYFNQSYMFSRFNEGEEVLLYGRAAIKKGRCELNNPHIYNEKEVGILPIYKLPAGITQKLYRDAVLEALKCARQAQDISKEALLYCGLMKISDIYIKLHKPINDEDIKTASKNAALKEMLKYTLSLKGLSGKTAPALKNKEAAYEEYLSDIEFIPTDAQKRAMKEIADDMSKKEAMNRLLEGDVGSGKTCVAFFAAYFAKREGMQTLLMAPTEILAEQHYENAKKIFKTACALYTSATPKKTREDIEKAAAEGKISLIIGTHALLYADIKYKNPALIITDEQHRFGVAQRAKLEGGLNVHTLVMSATPIPRTLSLIVYGEMGLSVLDELPAGRKKINTSVVRPEKRNDMYNWIKHKLSEGEQAYVVCPLIEAVDEMGINSATEVYEELIKKGFNAGLLHGKMKNMQKREVMERFRAHKTDVLVSTTVIEVGVDVKNANIMVIENAERFGLAQLHQLRGRVGRGDREARCFLVSNADAQRLSVLKNCSDGFKIAEEDLKLRGAGELIGLKQSGEAGFVLDEKSVKESSEILRIIEEKFPDDYALLIKMAHEKYAEEKKIVLN